MEKLSKDAYRRQKVALDAELTRLGLRKSHLELAMGDPGVAANFVEMRRVTSELADVETALSMKKAVALVREIRSVEVRVLREIRKQAGVVGHHCGHQVGEPSRGKALARSVA